MIILHVLHCAKWDNNSELKKMNESKLENIKHILSFLKKFMPCYICSCSLNVKFQRMCVTF
jgi:hypothetical protein